MDGGFTWIGNKSWEWDGQHADCEGYSKVMVVSMAVLKVATGSWFSFGR